ncbi:hypothetical protein FRUB_02771 [Fimbriiglobus ruber]|uniref:Uncharacterized protein n=1 Tax=Fimbriiglobus ruber TaxID=1908690 RepID=A0A225DP45_9BACT|nr:hypothetical protein FRUB_02771 [Fimbriiglobus ruber]
MLADHRLQSLVPNRRHESGVRDPERGPFPKFPQRDHPDSLGGTAVVWEERDETAGRYASHDPFSPARGGDSS